MLAAEDQQTPAAVAAAAASTASTAAAAAAATAAAAAAPAPPASHETPPRGRSARPEPATSTPPLVTAPCLSRPVSGASLPAGSPSLRSPLLLTPRSPTYPPTSPHNMPSSPLPRDAAGERDARHAHPTLEWMNPLPSSPLLRETAGGVPGSEVACSCRSPTEVPGSVASTDVEDFASADEIDEADELPEPPPSRRRRASPAQMAAMHGAAEGQEPAHDNDLR